MKRWIRSLPGKTVLFVLCVLSSCILIASLAAAWFLTDGGLGFYVRPEEEIRREVAEEEYLSSGVYSCLYETVVNGNYYNDGNDYRITDGKNRIVFESDGAEEVSDWEYSMCYGAISDESGRIMDFYVLGDSMTAVGDAPAVYTVDVSVPDESRLGRRIAFSGSLVHFAWMMRYAVYYVGAGAFLLMILCFVSLLYAAGRRPDTEVLFPGPLEKIPWDILLAAFLCLSMIALEAVGNLFSFRLRNILLMAAVWILCMSAFLGLSMSFAGRLRRHTLGEGMLTVRIAGFLWRGIVGIVSFFRKGMKKTGSLLLKILRGLPLIWKTALCVCVLSFLEMTALVIASHDTAMLLLLFFLEKLLLVPCIFYFALCLRKLQKGGIALAGGDLSYQTDTEGMFWDLKKHGENLNSIAGGMAAAVEERTRSERMKTGLITNVSHDIKTPLTSIINYASLIGNEPCSNEKITEYAGVLVRQSQKLKRLLEDLVEASRASSGSIEVVMAPCDASVFLLQAAGEYEERLADAGLTLITKQPDKEVRILADGRRMWRIFDNLMNNICKYAQAGTRVYLTLEEAGRCAVITFKNTSSAPLDIPKEELMERFVRGDPSRSTEGSGLGLSIARSMAELQNGSLRISIDGDLFKTVLSFPVI